MWRPTIGRWGDSRREYRVTLSTLGPRGGKRPSIVDVNVYADTQEEAIGKAKRYMNRRLRIEVTDA